MDARNDRQKSMNLLVMLLIANLCSKIENGKFKLLNKVLYENNILLKRNNLPQLSLKATTLLFLVDR